MQIAYFYSNKKGYNFKRIKVTFYSPAKMLCQKGVAERVPGVLGAVGRHKYDYELFRYREGSGKPRAVAKSNTFF